jgi:hypothetical protein
MKVKASPIKKAITCAYCGPGITHIIDPTIYANDIYAEGDRCGNCIDREWEDKIIRVTPNSQRAKEIIAERKSKQESPFLVISSVLSPVHQKCKPLQYINGLLGKISNFCRYCPKYEKD